MATLTIDTYKFINKLKASGMDEKQAETVAEVLQDVNIDHVASLADLKDLEVRLSTKFFFAIIGQTAILTALIKLL